MLSGWFRNVLRPERRRRQDVEKSNQQTSDPINPSLPQTLSLLKSKLGQGPDFVIRDFSDNPDHVGHLAVCYIEGLIDQNLLSDVMEGIIAERVSATSVKLGENSAASLLKREGTPFPALLEALIMELMFEVIREAGVRMPRVIGPAVSIVGALVIGQAAVQAGLVSGAMVIVVAFTAISNFVIPYVTMASAVRLLRFALMLLAAALGLFGILIGLIPLLVHLVSLKSFGVNYFMPYSPFYKSNMKDLVIRVPWWAMKTRPSEKSGSNKTRQATHQYPASSDENRNNKSDTQK